MIKNERGEEGTKINKGNNEIHKDQETIKNKIHKERAKIKLKRSRIKNKKKERKVPLNAT
jgi:hypothetical protein